MYHLLILDDDPDQVDLIRTKVAHYPGSDALEIKSIGSPAELAANVDWGIDILCADIRLDPDGTAGEPDGIEVVRRLQARARGMQVIYITGYDSYHTRVYQTEHVYFLTKPIVQAELDDALDAAISRLDQYVERPLGIQSSHALKTVYPRQIAFVESKRRVLHIHVERASRHELITTYARLGDLERELPSYFVRCHKSFLVNLNFVDEVRREAFSLSTGDEVPISRPRKDEMQQAYIAHMRTLRR